MTLSYRGSARFRALLLVACFGFSASTRNAVAQDTSAVDLIRFLSYQADRPHKGIEGILFGCGQVTADLAAAISLANLGEAAIPEIEKTLDAIEKRGWGWGSSWLQLAYARIKGHAAYLRLRRMEGDPGLGFDRKNVDSAIALSLGLTSYVSDSRLAIRSIRCTRGPEPRDALDRFILGWQRNDRPWLEASLGPTARAAVNSLLNGRTWAAVRVNDFETAGMGV